MMSSPMLRVASVVWAGWLYGLSAAAEAPPAPLERLTVEVDGVVCEYSPGDEILARALAGRMAGLHRESDGVVLRENLESTEPLAAVELMENRLTYLAAIARHLALEEPLATQEECYLVFAEAGAAFERLNQATLANFQALRHTKRLALWDRDELIVRLQSGQTIEGFTWHADSGKVTATFGAHVSGGPARLKEASERISNHRRNYRYRMSKSEGRVTSTAQVSLQREASAGEARGAGMAIPSAYVGTWPFALTQEIRNLPTDEAVERMIAQSYRAHVATIEKGLPNLRASDPNHAFLVLHETIEVGLLDAYIRSKDRRWFCDGVANYLAWRVVRDLHGAEQANRMYNLRDQLARYEPMRDQVDLARWPASEHQPESEQDTELNRAHYAFATRAVELMHEKHGDDILARLLAEVGKTPRDRTSMHTVEKAWHRLTRTSLDSLLQQTMAPPKSSKDRP